MKYIINSRETLLSYNYSGEFPPSVAPSNGGLEMHDVCPVHDALTSSLKLP